MWRWIKWRLELCVDVDHDHNSREEEGREDFMCQCVVGEYICFGCGMLEGDGGGLKYTWRTVEMC